MSMIVRTPALILIVLAWGCTGTSAPTDGGSIDAASIDAGSIDAPTDTGVAPIDAPARVCICIPNGVIAATNRGAEGPPSSIGTRWPYGSTGAITATSTKRAPVASITSAMSRLSAGDTELRSA